MTLYIGNQKVKLHLGKNKVCLNKIINLVWGAMSSPGGSTIYNSVGYQDQMRWTASGKAETTNAYGRLSGWIPAKKHKKYTVRGFGVNRTQSRYVDGLYIVKHYTDGTIVTTSTGSKTGSTFTVDLINDVVSFKLTDTNIDYFRVSGFYITDDGIVINPPLIMVEN